MTEIKEQWSWKKFLLGIFDGKNYAKAVVFGVCLAIIVSTLALSAMGVIWVKDRFFKDKDKEPLPDVVTGETVSIDKSTKKSDFTIFKFGGTDN